jgi:hypothetical protein
MNQQLFQGSINHFAYDVNLSGLTNTDSRPRQAEEHTERRADRQWKERKKERNDASIPQVCHTYISKHEKIGHEVGVGETLL